MPNRLNEKLKKKFYLSYLIGESQTYEQDNYSACVECSGVFANNSKNNTVNVFGVDESYTTILIVEADKNTKYIDRFSKIWLEKPFNVNDIADFFIVSVMKPNNGLIQVYLKSSVNNDNTIWYEYNGSIYSVNCKFDIDTLTMYKPKNMYLPIDKSVKVWYNNPENGSEPIYLYKTIETDEYTILKFKS